MEQGGREYQDDKNSTHTHGHDGNAGSSRVRSRGVGSELGDGRGDLRLHPFHPLGEVVPAVEADGDQAPRVGCSGELNTRPNSKVKGFPQVACGVF